MRKRTVLVGSTAVAAVAVVAGGAMITGGTSLTSGTVPTSTIAGPSGSSTPGTATKPHRHFVMMRRFGGPAVYAQSIVPLKAGGYRTIIEVKGTLAAISTTSISVKRPDTGALVTAAITSSTKFPRTSESALAADLGANKVVTVRMVEVGGTAKVVVVPPPPGTRPHPFAGHFTPTPEPAAGGSGVQGTSGSATTA